MDIPCRPGRCTGGPQYPTLEAAVFSEIASSADTQPESVLYLARNDHTAERTRDRWRAHVAREALAIDTFDGLVAGCYEAEQHAGRVNHIDQPLRDHLVDADDACTRGAQHDRLAVAACGDTPEAIPPASGCSSLAATTVRTIIPDRSILPIDGTPPFGSTDTGPVHEPIHQPLARRTGAQLRSGYLPRRYLNSV